jgi:RNase adaptor protein for sRNA GlmZ degradation
MTRVLITGMSGTGKSTALVELARRGHHVVDADSPEWSVEIPSPGPSAMEHVWREAAMTTLLAEHDNCSLFVAGCASNQGRFYNCFDAVVLLSAPVDVMLQRIAIRLTNQFGKTTEERRRILADLEAVEPLLRATSTIEIVTTIPVTEVADALETVAREAQPRPAWGSATDQPELGRACRANEP